MVSLNGVRHYRASLGRLGVDKLGLYQIHWPAFGTNWFRNDAFIQVGIHGCIAMGAFLTFPPRPGGTVLLLLDASAWRLSMPLKGPCSALAVAPRQSCPVVFAAATRTVALPPKQAAAFVIRATADCTA